MTIDCVLPNEEVGGDAPTIIVVFIFAFFPNVSPQQVIWRLACEFPTEASESYEYTHYVIVEGDVNNQCGILPCHQRTEQQQTPVQIDVFKCVCVCVFS